MRSRILTELRRDRIVAIVRGQSSGTMRALAEALLEGGIRFMEVTFRQDAPETWPDTAKAIRDVSRAFPGRMNVGAGTVLTLEQLELARSAGARFIISPNADRRVIEATRTMGLVSLPGAMTPTEIVRAHEWGADIVKIFPAGRLGPGYFRDIRAPLSHIPLMAVGGVNEKNAAEFLAAGAMGVGVGGNLVNGSWIAAGEYEKIAALAAEYARAARETP